MNPTACHNCPDNPIGEGQQKLDQEAFERHTTNILLTEQLYDATRLGFLRDLAELDMIEFDMLRRYCVHIDRLKMQSGIRF